MNPFRINFAFIFILIFMAHCSKPTIACFVSSGNSISKDSSVTLNAACSENASYYTWNFGDNTKDTTTTDFKIQHQYSNSGQYTITLHAKRKDGVANGSDTKATQMITVL